MHLPEIRRIRLPFMALLMAVMLMLSAAPEAAHAQTQPAQGCQSDDSNCNVCINETNQFSTPNLGANLVQDVFTTINNILQKIEKDFYDGIVNNSAFKNAVGVAFIVYIVIYGMMIMFNLASWRSGEVISRLIKIGIVYMMTIGGWSYFSNWVQTPVVNGINQLITAMADTDSSTGNVCSSSGTVGSSGSTVTSGTETITLATGPVSMLYGPITCALGAKLIAGIEALLMTGPFGWLLALGLLWALLEFVFMVLAALATYVKAMVGMTFLFGLAPIFFAFLLFEKTRYIFKGWLDMVISFALQPVMVFAFLAFFATILGTALNNIFVDSNNNPEDICYVPWIHLPGGLSILYWWRFKNPSGAAGGNWVDSSGNMLGTPVSILNLLFFFLLAHLGKSFSKYIDKLSRDLAGGSGFESAKSEEVGSWFRTNLTRGGGVTATTAALLGGAVSSAKALGSYLTGSDNNPTVARAAIGGPQAMVGKRSFDRSSPDATGGGGSVSEGGVSNVNPVFVRGDGSAENPGNAATTQKRSDSAMPGMSRKSGGELKMLMDAYRSLNNKYGGSVDKERQEIVRNIEVLTGKNFDPGDYGDKG